MLSFCSQLLLLTSLEFVFFYSTMFDVFCVKISLICVKCFDHNINLKKNKPFLIQLKLALIHQNCFFLDLLLFLTGLSSKCQICISWKCINEFCKTSIIWDYLSICSSNWSKMREIVLLKKDKLSLSHKKRQPKYYMRKMFWSHHKLKKLSRIGAAIYYQHITSYPTTSV